MTTMTETMALSFGIFALNTLQHPEASSQSDMDSLDLHSDEAISRLAEMRDRTSGRIEAPQLTSREIEVLELVATGMSYRQIGAHLFISYRTVQNHVQNILHKLGLHNRSELMRFAIARKAQP